MSPVCASCASQISEDGKFCRVCGTPVNQAPDDPQGEAPVDEALSGKCRSCAAELIAGARFCHLCGSSVAREKEPRSTPEAIRELGGATITSRTLSGMPAGSPPHICAECGAAVAERASFCRACGAAQADSVSAVVTPLPAPRAVRQCPACRSQVEGWAAFCRHCGVALPAGRQDDVSPKAAVGVCSVCGAAGTPGGTLCVQCQQAMGA